MPRFFKPYFLAIFVISIASLAYADSSDNSRLQTIELKQETSVLDVSEKYPFLSNQLLVWLKDEVATTSQNKFQLFLQEITLKKQPVLIVQAASSLNCGSHGCTTKLYNLNSHRLLLDVVSYKKMYALSCSQASYIIFPNTETNYSIWTGSSGQFAHMMTLDSSLKDVSTCRKIRHKMEN